MSRRYFLLEVVWCSAILALASSGVAQVPTIYNVFNMPAGDTSMQFVNVGDPGNTGDTQKMNGKNLINTDGSYDSSSGYGAVSYSYAIGTYDVTAAQYVQFLNAVAWKSDPYGLYYPAMLTATDSLNGTVAIGGKLVSCGIKQTLTAAGTYSYSLTSGTDSYNVGGNSGNYPANCANLPVNWVSWGDAARFCNWLENGQPSGGTEGAGTTETGSYTLNGGTTTTALFGVTHNAGAKYWIPTENEWYKAAYYKGGGTSSGYWYYPTQASKSGTPSSMLSTTGTNNANFNSSGLQSPNNWSLTPVGYYAGSPSHYGTFDQGGDLYNFTETSFLQGNSNPGMGEGQFVEVLRGGSFHHSVPDELASNWRYGADPAKFGHGRSFRIATTISTTQWSGAGNGNWSSMTDWGGDAAPSSGMALQFGAVSGGTTATNNDLTAGTSFDGITFTSAAPSYSLLGDTIDLAGPIRDQSSSNEAVDLSMILIAGGGTLNVSSGSLTLGGTVSDSGLAKALTLVGSGSLVLVGTGSYTGGTLVDGGTLILTSSSALADGTGLTVGDGSAFAVTPPTAGSLVTSSPASPVPEPGAFALLAAGLVAAFARWRRTHRGN